MKPFAISLLLLLTSLTLSVTASHDHVYDKNGIHIEWRRDGGVNIDYPDDLDCYGGCDSNRCNLGICFAVCYDRNKDFLVSNKELEHALDDSLSWYEKMVAHSASSYIEMFDGADGSSKDGRISLDELRASTGHCGDLSDMEKYLCNRCDAYREIMH